MNEITIEKGIEMPEKGVRNKYPFHLMNVGDSFKVDTGKLHSVRSSAYNYKYRTGNDTFKFEFRKVDESWRCWRVK